MNTQITILYEDKHIVAIDKPAGIIVHADGKRNEPTLVDWFLEHYPDSREVGEEPIETQNGGVIVRPGVVHRLDRDTSGVMVWCKTARAHEHLKSQFKNHTTVKTYMAIVYGSMKQDSYELDTAIGRAKTFGRWTSIPKAIRGKQRDAQTTIVVEKRFNNQGQDYSLVRAIPKTGRTHQIRVHLQYLNHPIVADPLYAGKRNEDLHNLGFKRQALHAQSLVLENLDGTILTLESPLPREFTNFT